MTHAQTHTHTNAHTTTATPHGRHQVTTHTSDIKGAGTDANVCCEFFGAKGSSGPRELTGKGNLFEKVRVYPCAPMHTCALAEQWVGGRGWGMLHPPGVVLYASWHNYSTTLRSH